MSYEDAFKGEHLTRILREWAADQREREAWKDADASTYRYRATALEAALAEIALLRSTAREHELRIAEKAVRAGAEARPWFSEWPPCSDEVEGIARRVVEGE